MESQNRKRGRPRTGNKGVHVGMSPETYAQVRALVSQSQVASCVGDVLQVLMDAAEARLRALARRGDIVDVAAPDLVAAADLLRRVDDASLSWEECKSGIAELARIRGLIERAEADAARPERVKQLQRAQKIADMRMVVENLREEAEEAAGGQG